MANRTAAKRPSADKPAKPSRTRRRTAPSRANQHEERLGVSSNAQVGMLGGLVLAMVLAGLGFIVSVFWVGAIIVMAVLLGLSVAERRGRASGTGAVTEVVAAVVDEVNGISESTARLRRDNPA